MKALPGVRSLGGRQSLISLASFCVSLLALTALLPVLVRTLGARAYGAWVLTGGILRIAHTLAVGLEIVETATRVLGAVHLATDGGE